MAIVAPKGRRHLSANALFGLVRNGFATIPDYRLSDTDIALTDALMSAFAMFSLKIERVPCDTHMREILDPVFPESLRPVFTSVFRQLQRGKALEQ